MNSWKDHLSSSPEICGGQVCIKGTRVMISVILDNVAENLSYDEIVESYPTITKEDIRAAVLYAAMLTREEIVTLS